MLPSVSYILYGTSSHEKIGGIRTFVQFEEDNLLENWRILTEENKSISASIDESYTHNESDDGSISTNDVEDIQDGN